MIQRKIMAFISFILILSCALIGTAQMNRDTPSLVSKISDIDDDFSAAKAKISGSTAVISEPNNREPVSDLMIEADAANTTCDAVSFLLTLTAAPDGSSGYQPVRVRILEDRLGTLTSVAELVVLMPANGGSVHETVGFISACGSTAGNCSNQITVAVDPDSEFSETDEENNNLIIIGNCPG